MSHHLSTEDVQRYRQRQMSPEELRATHDHIAGCEACRAQLRDEERSQVVRAALWADLQSARVAAEHLSYERLEAFVDESLNAADRERVENHLTDCSECADRARNLRTFRAMMTTDEPAKQQSSKAAKRRNGETTHQRFPFRLAFLQFVGTAAVAVLCVWLAMRPLQKRMTDLRAKVDNAQHEKVTLLKEQESLRKKVAALPDLQRQVEHLKREKEKLVQRIKQQKRDSTITRLPPSVKAVFETGRVKTQPALLAQLDVKSGGSPMSSGGAFHLESPVRTVVLTDRPMFRWKPLPGATKYTISVFDGKGHEVISEKDVGVQTKWMPEKPLPRGRVLHWKVIAYQDDEPTFAEAKFKILEKSEATQLEQAKKTYANSPLTLGILFAEKGLMEDAEREFQRLLRGGAGAME
jgi:predicted ester cyclase